MQIFLDGFLWETKWSQSLPTNKCGRDKDDWLEKIYEVEVSAAHNSPGLNVAFTSTVKKTPELASWGLRNFKVSFLACPGDCGICHSEDARQC